MGGYVSTLVWGSDPDVPDPVSGMTLREIYRVQKTWIPVYKNPVACGLEIFIRIFHKDPKAKDYFKFLKNVPQEQYGNSSAFQAHILGVMAALHLAVTHLKEPEIVVAMMNKLGRSHGAKRIPENNFNEMNDIVRAIFIEKLMDDSDLAAWGKALDFFFKHILETLNTCDEG